MNLYSTARDGEIRIYSPLGEKIFKIVNYQVVCLPADIPSLLPLSTITTEKPAALLAEETRAKEEKKAVRAKRHEVATGR